MQRCRFYKRQRHDERGGLNPCSADVFCSRESTNNTFSHGTLLPQGGPKQEVECSVVELKSGTLSSSHGGVTDEMYDLNI